MDVLDSLDLDTKDKKSLRVRSWYLYEQYKSLERHQLDAAQKLKNRSYQDRILRQELSERRARRKLYDQFGLCQSESSIQKTISNHTPHAPTLSASNDDFFESFSDQDDERVTRETEFDFSEGTTINKSSMEDFKSLEELNDNVSNSDSINSVVEIVTTTDNADIKCNSDSNAYSENANCLDENFVSTIDETNEYEYINDSQITPVIIAQDINKQLDSVREDIQCLEDITKLELVSSREVIQCLEDITKLGDKRSDNVSECSQDDCHHPKFIRNEDKEGYKDIIPVWSKLVSYAYQIVQLNHGNSYCDYSSQFLTAVLACDILRRCVNRMCNILQPYVSPISFVTDDDKFDPCYKFGKTKKLVQSRKSKKIIENKPIRRINRHNNSSRLAHKNYSENCWNSYIRRASFENRSKSKYSRRASEPWRSVVKNPLIETSSTASSSMWSQISKENNMSRHMFKSCTCCRKAVNPMLKIARYIDSILKDINDS